MASFVDYTSGADVWHIYRPKSSPYLVPRKWWQYAIHATILSKRQDTRLDIWKLVSDLNEEVLARLYEDHPPPAIRMRKELASLREEVVLLREENETLRKMLSDALEPSIKKSYSIPTLRSDKGDDDIIELQEGDGFSGLTSHTQSAMELLNIEDEEQNALNVEASTSIDTENYQGLAQESIESTALTHSPYEKLSNIMPSLSPAQGTIVSYLQKLNSERKTNNDSVSVTSSKVSDVQQKADIKRNRERSTILHRERIFVSVFTLFLFDVVFTPILMAFPPSRKQRKYIWQKLCNKFQKSMMIRTAPDLS